jgi:hypothetical protein
MAKVDADGAMVALADVRLDAAGHARAAAEGDGGCAGAAAPFEDGRHVALVTRERDEVGRVRVVATKRTLEVTKRSPVRVRGPVVRI